MLALGAESVAATPPPCEAPAGTAAVDQYCEEVPSADGMGQQTDDALQAVPLEQLLAGRVAGKLAASGRLGRAVLSTPAPVPLVSPAGNGTQLPPGTAAGIVGTGALARPEGGPAGALARSVRAYAFDGSFRWVLSASTIGLFAAAWFRLRRRDEL